jgi:hypothetical protein
MSDDAAKEAENTEADGKPPVAVDISKEVTTKVADLQTGGEVRKRVVDELVEDEIAKRSKKLATVLAKRQEAWRELQKIKPDQASYNEKHEKVSETYSKGKMEERKKLEEKIAKMDKAINKAVNDADYAGLDKFTSS